MMGSMLLLLQTPHPHLSLPRGGITAALVLGQTHHAVGGARKKHSACALCRGAGAALVPPPSWRHYLRLPVEAALAYLPFRRVKALDGLARDRCAPPDILAP